MKDVTLNNGTAALQSDTDSADTALDSAAHRDLLRDHVALHLCAFANQELGRAQLAFDSPEDLGCTIAFDLADV
jgi:hypothetical protein